MTQRARKVAVILGAATLSAGAAVGVTAATNSGTPSTAATADRQFGPGGGRPGGFGGGPDLSALAGRLGVSTSRLEQAMQAVGPPGGGRGGRAAALAQELGLPAAKVESALQALRPDGPPPGGANPPTQTR
jgi:hypothetical protein